MINIFKKKDPYTYNSSNSSSYQNQGSLYKASSPTQQFQSLFSNPVPQAPKVTSYSSPQNQSVQPKTTANQSTYIPASGYGSQYADNPNTYKPTTTTSAPTVTQKQNPQLTLMDDFLKSQRGVADQKKQLAEELYQSGNQYRTNTYNLQNEQLQGARGSAIDAFNQFEQGTLGSLDRVRAAGERNKTNAEDYYGDAQREAAMARRETQGDAQRRFSSLNTIDSFGEGSFQQANENIDSDFNRVTQQIARAKADQLAEIDDQIFSAEQTAEQAIQAQRIQLQQVLRQIDGQLAQGSIEHKFAQDQAMAQYQEAVSGIEEWFSGIQYQTQSQKLALEQELASLSSFTPEFMATGVPTNQKEYEFLISNSDTFKDLYPTLFGGTSNDGKQEIIDAINDLGTTGLGSVFGYGRLNPLNNLPESSAQTTKAKLDRIRGLVSLENANKLKGQGSITESERQLLANAATTLSNPNISPAYAKQELDRLLEQFGGQRVSSSVNNDQLVSQFGG